MNIHLLYPDKDWLNMTPYFDYLSVVQDLSLHILFRMASRDVVLENGEVKNITDTDPFVQDAMKKIMVVPLTSKEEILYRQEIVKDCINEEDFIRELYVKVTDILKAWEQLGRRENKRSGKQNTVSGLVTEVHVLKLFVKGLTDIKRHLTMYMPRLHSTGFNQLLERLNEVFSDEEQEKYESILKDISFFIDNHKEDANLMTINSPKIVIECGVADGLKLSDIKLDTVACETKRYRDPNSALGKFNSFLNARTPGAIAFQKDTPIYNQVAGIEYEVVKYIMASCDRLFTTFNGFFDQLRLQTAFYVGAVNLTHHIERFELEMCYPTVGEQDELYFEDLKEFVMCIEQRVKAVGNDVDIKNKMLLIVTGANQGGKSTFLRSIGVAQIMMQAGLPVTAKRYRTGIFPAFFTHFTRREDSAMNSGRLDEELGRMNQIIENLGENSLILLNESFATTTEKEGSVIAYDIIKALSEAGVKILTVTHLLSFAQKIYEEAGEAEAKGEPMPITFLSAERREDGKRTFKMIQHAPELTSFGLDLYESIINGVKEKR
ncbi:MAG: hypothetical protein MJ114_00830 [Acetatifactor sp.]|nr:hypothetical protein [Acetatifactor sp.]